MGINIFFSSEQMSLSWSLIYEEYNFPVVVRYQLTEWLEKIPWYDLKSDNKANAGQMYQGLLNELAKKIKDTANDKLVNLQLITAMKKIREDFGARPCDLVDVLKNCFNRERLLIASTQPDKEAESTEEDKELLKYRQKETDFGIVIAVLKQRSQELEVMIDEFHNIMQTGVAKIKDLQDQLKSETILDPFKTNMVLAQMKEEKLIEKHKTTLAGALTAGAQELYRVLQQHCWSLIAHYKQQQKLSTCYLAKTPEGAVDTLNKVCEECNKQLKDYIHNIERVRADFHLYSQNSGSYENIDILSREFEVLLSQHLKWIFVITKQPPNVQKIVQNKSPLLSMCVRMLGGRALGFEHTLPSVTVRVYSESTLHKVLAVAEPSPEDFKGVCKMENGNNVMMELKRSTGHIQANLNNVQLRNVERLERKVKEDRVTEHKYGMVFFTQVNVCNKRHNLKALSWPIVLTSQTSQNGAAKGTLVWDAAFSIKDREMFEDEPTVPWFKMADVLKAMFKETGHELNQAQVNYIARYIFKSSSSPELDEDLSNCILTKEKFLRDKVPGKDFTFWRWIYACNNLITNDLSQELKDKMIYGFIGRQEAEKLLEGKKPGTFLLRFREGRLESSQRALKCACLAVAVVVSDPVTRETKVNHVKDHLTPTDIHTYTLMRILNSMVEETSREPLLITLYPDIDFEELVKKYLPDTGDASEGYSRTRFLIGIEKRRGDSSMDGSTCDGSLAPNTPKSIMSDSNEPFLSDTNESFLSDTNLVFCPGIPLSDDLQSLNVEPLMGLNDGVDVSVLMIGSNMTQSDLQIPLSVFELQLTD